MGRDYVTDDNDLAAAYALRVQAKIYLAVGAVIWLLILCFGHVVWQSELFDSLWWAVALIIVVGAPVAFYVKWRKYRSYHISKVSCLTDTKPCSY